MLTRERELVALHYLSSWCLVTVNVLWFDLIYSQSCRIGHNAQSIYPSFVVFEYFGIYKLNHFKILAHIRMSSCLLKKSAEEFYKPTSYLTISPESLLYDKK